MSPWLVEVTSHEEVVSWLGKESPDRDKPVRMIVRGDGPRVRELLPNVLDAAKVDTRRIVIWVRDPALLTDAETAALFNGSQEILAVVISEGEPRAWVYEGAIRVDDALFAFASAVRAA
jgi:3-deoxy-D-arabino-heptulosonate 7-phosphate (DAHP) synthase class II